MIIKSITLNNFRQYYGENTIFFSTSNKRNVTVIHGENGSGKTALLNAITWCLYDERLDLPNRDKLINDYKLYLMSPEEETEVYVELTFQSGDFNYSMRKSVKVKKTLETEMFSHSKPTIELWMTNFAGNTEKVENYTNEINHLIPSNLKSYFFFDGERIDNLSKEDSSEDVKNAIKNIMNINILENAISHTDEVRKRFRKIRSEEGSEEIQSIYENEIKLEKEYEMIEEKISNFKSEISTAEESRKATEQQLSEVEEMEELMKDKEDKESKLADKKEKLNNLDKDLRHILSNEGYLALTTFISEEIKNNNVDYSNKKGTSSVSKRLIDEIIESGVCICGQEISEDSSHRQHLLDLASSLDDRKDNVINKLYEQLGMVNEKKNYLIERARQIRSVSNEIRKEKKVLETELEQIQEDLIETDIEKASNLGKKLAELNESIKKNEIDKRIQEEKLKEKKEELDKHKREKEQAEKKQSKVELNRERMEACESILDTFRRILSVREQEVKLRVQERVSDIFDRFLRKSYKVLVSENYTLEVQNQFGKSVALSQGERQITSLAFIAGIVDIAREQEREESNTELDDGGVYPLVMDSPFGALDSNHRERVAGNISKLVNQLIVIVSTSQWEGEVESNMYNLTGKEYKLIYNDPTKNPDEPYEYTRIEEVTTSG